MDIITIKNKLTNEEWTYVSKCVRQYERSLALTRERCKRHYKKTKKKMLCGTCNVELSSNQALRKHFTSKKHLDMEEKKNIS